MKVVFVGPSLAGITLPGKGVTTNSHADLGSDVPKDIEFRPPAIQGDIMRAIKDGATVIGLIDGQFEYVAPVWHKELLFALDLGIAVLGASSMGALRAVECQAFVIQDQSAGYFA